MCCNLETYYLMKITIYFSVKTYVINNFFQLNFFFQKIWNQKKLVFQKNKAKNFNYRNYLINSIKIKIK